MSPQTSQAKLGATTRMSARDFARSIVLAIAACGLIAGCGQSGPLTLPEETIDNEVQNEEDAQDNEQEEDEQE